MTSQPSGVSPSAFRGQSTPAQSPAAKPLPTPPTRRPPPRDAHLVQSTSEHPTLIGVHPHSTQAPTVQRHPDTSHTVARVQAAPVGTSSYIASTDQHAPLSPIPADDGGEMPESTGIQISPFRGGTPQYLLGKSVSPKPAAAQHRDPLASVLADDAHPAPRRKLELDNELQVAPPPPPPAAIAAPLPTETPSPSAARPALRLGEDDEVGGKHTVAGLGESKGPVELTPADLNSSVNIASPLSMRSPLPMPQLKPATSVTRDEFFQDAERHLKGRLEATLTHFREPWSDLEVQADPRWSNIDDISDDELLARMRDLEAENILLLSEAISLEEELGIFQRDPSAAGSDSGKASAAAVKWPTMELSTSAAQLKVEKALQWALEEDTPSKNTMANVEEVRRSEDQAKDNRLRNQRTKSTQTDPFLIAEPLQFGPLSISINKELTKCIALDSAFMESPELKPHVEFSPSVDEATAKRILQSNELRTYNEIYMIAAMGEVLFSVSGWLVADFDWLIPALVTVTRNGLVVHSKDRNPTSDSWKHYNRYFFTPLSLLGERRVQLITHCGAGLSPDRIMKLPQRTTIPLIPIRYIPSLEQSTCYPAPLGGSPAAGGAAVGAGKGTPYGCVPVPLSERKDVLYYFYQAFHFRVITEEGLRVVGQQTVDFVCEKDEDCQRMLSYLYGALARPHKRMFNPTPVSFDWNVELVTERSVPYLAGATGSAGAAGATSPSGAARGAPGRRDVFVLPRYGKKFHLRRWVTIDHPTGFRKPVTNAVMVPEYYPLLRMLTPEETQFCSQAHCHPHLYLNCKLELLKNPAIRYLSFAHIVASLMIPGRARAAIPYTLALELLQFFLARKWITPLDIIEVLPAQNSTSSVVPTSATPPPQNH